MSTIDGVKTLSFVSTISESRIQRWHRPSKDALSIPDVTDYDRVEQRYLHRPHLSEVVTG